MHEILINHFGGLSLPRKSVARLPVTDRPDMTSDVYRRRETTNKQQQLIKGQQSSRSEGVFDDT